jgi:mRNA-degrading endonuclease YafQ of YafQ-DinJ toxin-antitoxin module
MKFRRTPQFRDDFNRLSDAEKEDVNKAFNNVVLALQGDVDLFRHHRIKTMEGWPGIWEGHVKQNLCFTFHYEYTDDGEKVYFFRRIGTHGIYNSP